VRFQGEESTSLGNRAVRAYRKDLQIVRRTKRQARWYVL
jgi:hypothetical protein